MHASHLHRPRSFMWLWVLLCIVIIGTSSALAARPVPTLPNEALQQTRRPHHQLQGEFRVGRLAAELWRLGGHTEPRQYPFTQEPS